MARRPDILSDRDDWGAVLNEYLDVSLNEDGTIKDAALAPVVGPLVADALADDDTPAQAAAAAVDAEIAGRELVEGKRFSADELAVAITDQNGHRSWLEARKATGGPSDHAAALLLDVLAPLLNDPAVLPGLATEFPDGWGWRFAITDSADRIAFGIRDDGTVYPEASTTVALVDAIDPTRNLVGRDALGNIRPFTSTPAVVTFWGDSLFAGYPRPPFLADQSNTLPGVFASLHTAGTVTNLGSTGQTASMIAFRQGGMVPLVMPVGGSIPASGTVTVTTDQNMRLRDNIAMSASGTLAGVNGTLTFSGDTPRVVTFTRSAAGSEVPVATPTPFLVTGPANHREGIIVVTAGRNDVTFHTGDIVGDVVANTAAMVDSLTPMHPRALLLGTLTATSETRGTPNYEKVVAINAALADIYPEYFWDFRGWLVNEALGVLGITPTSDDLAAIAEDTLPPSLMEDDRHYSPATAAAAAQTIYDLMQTRGWL